MYATAQGDSQMEQLHLDRFDFGRRFAMEKVCENRTLLHFFSSCKELERSPWRRHQNLLFDESSNFLLIPSMVGVKIVNIVTNKLVRVIGRPETERPLSIALLQDLPKKVSHKLQPSHKTQTYIYIYVCV